jgi:hypothetical protein
MVFTAGEKRRTELFLLAKVEIYVNGVKYVKHVCHHIVKAVKTWPVPGNTSM